MSHAKSAQGANNYDRFKNISISDDEDEAPPKAASPPPPPRPKSPPPVPPPGPSAPAPPSRTPDSAQASSRGEDAPAGSEPVESFGKGYRYWSQSKCVPRVVPRKIDPSEAAKEPSTQAGSAWNAAQTYEEVSVTAWAKDHMERAFSSLSFEPTAGAKITCGGVREFQGDVGVHIIRGRKRFLFDVTFAIPFDADWPHADKLYKGEIRMGDFSSHERGDWEVRLRGRGRRREAGARNLSTHSRTCAGLAQVD